MLPVVCLLLAGAGCDELEARRNIQKGNKLYQDGKFSKAVEKYEEALAVAPHLAIGQHNAGLAYHKLFVPGNPGTENQAIAVKATEHLQAYLKSNPTDAPIVQLMTTIWIDSDRYEEALTYWGKSLEENPKDTEALEKMASINLQAGQHEAALEWLEKKIAALTDSDEKINTYLKIAQVQISRLRKSELVDLERLAVADRGIAAAQKAEAMAPENPRIKSVLGALFQFRAVAHGASWAQMLDNADFTAYAVRAYEITKAKAAKDAPKQADGKKAEAEEKAN